MKFQAFLFSAFVIILLSLSFSFPQNPNHSSPHSPNLPTSHPIELGKVNWLRDMDEAVAKSQKEAKPILILFQEVPGCMTCQRYGSLTLSHPLIVEAIETHFVPLAIFNNKKGKDAAVLQYYNEPSWNNPVVRIVRSDKSNITDRLSADYSPAGLVNTMLSAFRQINQSPPSYLQLLHKELQAEAGGTEQATFSMYCFWTGEKELGQLDGVVKTKAGFMNGSEVVQVEYDPTEISFEHLLAKAAASKCASRVFTSDKNQKAIASAKLGEKGVNDLASFRPDKEPKYYLGKTIYQYLPMTELQAAQANALIGEGKKPDKVFSPRQLAKLEEIKKQPKGKLKSNIGKEMTSAWKWE